MACINSGNGEPFRHIDADQQGTHARTDQAEVGIGRNLIQDTVAHGCPPCRDILSRDLNK